MQQIPITSSRSAGPTSIRLFRFGHLWYGGHSAQQDLCDQLERRAVLPAVRKQRHRADPIVRRFQCCGGSHQRNQPGRIDFKYRFGIENATGSSGLAPASRNGGTWSVSSPEAWRFSPYVPGYTYAWTPSTGLDNPTIPMPVASGVPGTTVYTVTVTADGVCTATATALVNEGVALECYGFRASCFGMRRTIDATERGRFRWRGTIRL